MQARTSVVNFHKYTANEKTLLDWYCSTFDKGIRSIKLTPPIKVTSFHGIQNKKCVGQCVNKTKYFYVHIFNISNFDRNFGVTLIEFLKLRKLLFREAQKKVLFSTVDFLEKCQTFNQFLDCYDINRVLHININTQARALVVNFHKHTSNRKTLLDRYCSIFDKGTQSIKVTLPIKLSQLPCFMVQKL